MREAQLTVGMLLLFGGALMAIAGSTLNSRANIPSATLLQLLYVEVIATIISFVGGYMVIRNR
ncbi:hypothetical protein E6H36_10450 [Candidatus Bathyarchaeota archaeon]|nr:MAG: hypothetical protein AUJ07_00765 [Crenarchaeota archaeon 13_1_40CM_3_53_5]TMI23510.1 MAG: hypothetical protein E6H36_10450 [Candidatus Bathyarchaeota archaeon]TMI29925.1 MAG: hypothetical protein E6H29_10145 [Candidatus Bathyarchaeota archaeon]